MANCSLSSVDVFWKPPQLLPLKSLEITNRKLSMRGGEKVGDTEADVLAVTHLNPAGGAFDSLGKRSKICVSWSQGLACALAPSTGLIYVSVVVCSGWL